MFDKKQRSCVGRVHLVTDNGLYEGKASYKKNSFIIFTFFLFFVYVMFYIRDQFESWYSRHILLLS